MPFDSLAAIVISLSAGITLWKIHPLPLPPLTPFHAALRTQTSNFYFHLSQSLLKSEIQTLKVFYFVFTWLISKKILWPQRACWSSYTCLSVVLETTVLTFFGSWDKDLSLQLPHLGTILCSILKNPENLGADSVPDLLLT